MIRLGETPERDIVYRERPGAYALILRRNEALLTLEHGREGLEIALPGGGIDPGEGQIRALHREVMEETGWRIAIERRVGVYQRYCHMPEYQKHARKICHIFLARPIGRLSDPLELHHDAVWVPTDIALDMLTNPADGQFLARNAHALQR